MGLGSTFVFFLGDFELATSRFSRFAGLADLSSILECLADLSIFLGSLFVFSSSRPIRFALTVVFDGFFEQIGSTFDPAIHMHSFGSWHALSS